MKNYQYLLIGGGMTADSAARGIRQVDPDGSIGLIGLEPDPPYNRPPLSKGMWKGRPLNRIWRKTDTLGVEMHLGRQVVILDAARKMVKDNQGDEYGYEKLLLATGANPVRLPTTSERVIFYRTLADYQHTRALMESGQNFVVIGGGFIGSEMAAALTENGKQVTMVFPDDGLCARFLPPELSNWVSDYYRAKGVRMLPKQKAESMEERGDRLVLRLSTGEELAADGVIAGLGVRLNLDLAKQAGLEIDNGVLVDAKMRTSNPSIYAAGDIASFYNSALGKRIRVEHEENANMSGEAAGRSMAGGEGTYDFLPSFYSDLFDLGYNAVGELDARLETYTDWVEPGKLGTVYYLQDGRVRGVLLWNQEYKLLDPAREIIAAPGPFTAKDLTGRLR